MKVKPGGWISLVAIVSAMIYFFWMGLSSHEAGTQIAYFGVFAALLIALGQQLDSLGLYGEKEDKRKELDTKLTEIYSPIHAMVLAIKRNAPSRQPNERTFVMAEHIANLAQVQEIFQKHGHDLGNHHLETWLQLERQIAHGERGLRGFYLDAEWQQWFDELETEYHRRVAELKKPK